jgi:hypothetical protein
MNKFATKLSIALLAIAFCNTVWADALGVKLAVSSLRYVPAQKSEPINPEQKAWQDKAEKLLEVIYAGRLGNRVDPADIIYEAKRAGLDPTLIFATVEKLSGFEELYEGGFKSEVQHLQPVRSADAKPPETLSATPA